MVHFLLFISLCFSLCTFREIRHCEMNASGQQRMRSPKKLLHIAHGAGTPQGQQPRPSPAPRCGYAKEERIRSENELVRNLARYGFFLVRCFKAIITQMNRSKKGIRDDRLMGVNQLEQLSRDHSVPAGKSSFLKHLLVRRENKKLKM